MPSAPKRYRPAHQRRKTTQRSKASAERHKFYDTAAWRGRRVNGQWVGGIRNAVLERDEYTCQDCGRLVSGKSAHVDHIQSIEQRPDLMRDMSNLEVLCNGCHSSKTVNGQR